MVARGKVGYNGTYHPVLTARILGAFRYVPMNVGNTGGRNGWICVCCKHLLEQKVSNGHHLSDRTHVEELKDLVEVQSPGGDLFPVVLCMETLRKYVSFPPPDDILFNLYHNPEVR